MEVSCYLNVTDSTEPKMTIAEAKFQTLGVIVVEQFILKAGIAKSVNRAKTLITKELTQLHDMKTYICQWIRRR